jgi:hypothetical protein
MKTCWIDASDELNSILRYRDDVKSVRFAVCGDHVPCIFKRLFWELLPLKLFSLAVKARERKLHVVTPLFITVVQKVQPMCILLQDEYD